MKENFDHWKQVTPPVDVGFQFDYWVCRYCEAKVENEYGPWKPNNTRSKTQRSRWYALHEVWCIVPAYEERNDW